MKKVFRILMMVTIICTNMRIPASQQFPLIDTEQEETAYQQRLLELENLNQQYHETFSAKIAIDAQLNELTAQINLLYSEATQKTMTEQELSHFQQIIYASHFYCTKVSELQDRLIYLQTKIFQSGSQHLAIAEVRTLANVSKLNRQIGAKQAALLSAEYIQAYKEIKTQSQTGPISTNDMNPITDFPVIEAPTVTSNQTWANPNAAAFYPIDLKPLT